MHSRKDSEVATTSSDDEIMEKMGYKPSLYRGLGDLMNFAIGFSEVSVLASVCITFGVGISTGGPATLIWGFIVQCILVCGPIAFCMAEICSAFPCAGSVYHWAAQLAPEKDAPLWSYVCGWLNFLGNAAGDASFANGWAVFLSAGLVASGKEALTSKEIVGVSIAVLAAWTILNCFRIDSVGWIQNFSAVFQAFSIIIVFSVLFGKATEITSGKYIFTQYINDTGFDSKSYVVAAGLTASLFSFAGYEASAHMAEETHNSAKAAPRGLIATCFATGIGGLMVYFALLATFDYTAVSDDALAGTGNTVADIFIYVAGEKWGQALTWLVVINLFFAGMASVTVTGRITYALCRDGAFIGSEWLTVVNPTFKSPNRVLWFVGIFDFLLLLLPLDDNGGLAFYAIIGLATFGFQTSYGIPIFLKLVYPQPNFPLTPFNLGWLSKPFAFIACIWLYGTSCLLFLPLTYPVTELTMNWLIVVVGGISFLCGINWIISGQYNFKGPKRDPTATGQVLLLHVDAKAALNNDE